MKRKYRRKPIKPATVQQLTKLMRTLAKISQRICDLHNGCLNCPLNQGDDKCPFCEKLIGFNFCDFLRGCAENPYYECKICEENDFTRLQKELQNQKNQEEQIKKKADNSFLSWIDGVIHKK